MDRFRLNNGVQDLLNCSTEHDFEELMYWGRIEGMKADYYICMGVTYTDKYEFPEKRFFWASSTDFKFKAFPELNDQHKDKVDTYRGLFKGDPSEIHIKVVEEKTPEELEAEAAKEAEPKPERDPLLSTEEEDPNANFVPRNFTELDRLLYTVRAIENDCHIVPKGAMKLTEMHEVRRNNAFRGLPEHEAFSIHNYSHFRNVQERTKLANLMKDDAVFQRDFLDEACNSETKGAWSIVRGSTRCNIAVVRNHEWPGYTAFHK